MANQLIVSHEITLLVAAQFMVLADGDSGTESNQRRGEIFESFVAQLLSKDGYSTPTHSGVNVFEYGFELDIVTRHAESRQRLIVECKVRKRNIAAKHLLTFLGKLTLTRIDHPETSGLFVAVPGLTKNGETSFKKCQRHDSKFDYWHIDDIITKLRRHELIARLITPQDKTYRNPAVVVTEYGVCVAARLCDSASLAPISIDVRARSNSVPKGRGKK